MKSRVLRQEYARNNLPSVEETDTARPIADLEHQQPGEKESDPLEQDFFSSCNALYQLMAAGRLEDLAL